MNFVPLVLFALSLALALAISRIAVDVRKIRRHFDRIDKANAPAPVDRPAFVPPPVRTPLRK